MEIVDINILYKFLRNDLQIKKLDILTFHNRYIDVPRI